ncbi:glycosyl transferase family protein [Sphingomonas sp. SUN019]|uniref:glycosyl transferase family protein n=1 Tax=Sphingomonas sp. SUN019 TaxID=2937788 RepID=UPI0021640539|nr:glycosyl transferase family protein [Sphingomonas sp. SUN019]UVO51178.1 glycosyl transferase family protein [Sphingomonas sp. SUN019]
MGAIIVAWIDAFAREAMLFGAVGFVIGGVDDLLVDLVYLWRRIRGAAGSLLLDDLPASSKTGRLAVFVPAWDESAVIGAMLRTALARFAHPDYRIFVGCYPNDPATIDAVAAVAQTDRRVRLVIGVKDGPTTKADCLNALWRALGRDDAVARARTSAVVLHDAEDVVHPAELRVYDALLGDHAIVQIPVLPLIDRGARLVSGHYADEFSEAHGKQMVVRAAVGAGLPLAGVGCAISVAALEAIAARHGTPFDEDSLTEDYELGLRAGAFGGACFARVREYPGGPLVAVRAYFPATIRAAVIQKARWMTGIALAGWDRTGWSRPLHLADHWMRMRDRRAPVAVLVLAAAYVAVLASALGMLGHAIIGDAASAVSPDVRTLLTVTLALLLWRIAARALATGRSYGWREAVWSVPRLLVANWISLLAARRAIVRYIGILAGAPPRWDKTAHVFPDGPPETVAR